MKYQVLMFIYFFIVIFSILCSGLYILGIAHYFVGSDNESNTCELPYMFEYPEFVEIKMDDRIREQYPGFGLYVYGESDGVEELGQMEYSGIPVLFVPGNAGSHRQIRSIASVSLKMSLERLTSFHFDYFTISLNEGLSAFSGDVIEKQTDYVFICIHKVLSLYKGAVNQIVVIGHSMGGVVARAALLRDTSNITLASILINLASPYTPLVAFDRTFSNYYDNINNHETRLKEIGTSIIAIGGGPRDHMVATSHMIDPHADLNVLSTAIPNVWSSADHLSILWCKQFVIALVRALFDSVDVNGQIAKITSIRENRLRALKYHLSNRYATDYFFTHFETKINFETDGQWIEITSSNYNFDNENNSSNKEGNEPIYLMIPLKNNSFSHLSLDIINLEANDWLFICSASVLRDNSKACKWGWNLTNLTVLSPDYQQRIRKSVDLELKTLEKFSEETHIVIRIPMIEVRKKMSAIVYIDMYSREARQIHIDSVRPAWLPTSLGNIMAPSTDTAIEILPGTLRYFIDITTIPDAIYIKLDAITDNNGNNSLGYTVIQMKELCDTSNSAISQFHIFQEEDIGRRHTLRLQTGIVDSHRSNVTEIIISFNPRFQYSIRVGRAGVTDRMANFIKSRIHRLYPSVMSVLLLFIVVRIDKSQYSLPITFVMTSIASVILDVCLEVNVALCILSTLTAIICWAVIFVGTIIQNVIVRFLTRLLARFPASWNNGLICQSLNQLPLVAIILLIIFISCRCGALVMVLSALLYFLKLTSMYKDYLENSLMLLLRNFMRKFRGTHSINGRQVEDENIDSRADIMNHLLLVLIWFLTVGYGVPSILVWAKNFSYETRLFSEDPIMLGSWIILTIWSSLGFVKLPIIFEYHCYRVDPITMTQRILGWPLLWIAGSNNSVYYQWMILPIIALFISCHYLRRHCLYFAHCNPRFPELKKV